MSCRPAKRAWPTDKGNPTKLQTLAIVLLVLWLLGLVTLRTLGGIIHILLELAIVLFLVRILGDTRI
jgi:hypothetical protein